MPEKTQIEKEKSTSQFPIPIKWQIIFKQGITTGKVSNGCGSVGRAVASDTRGPRFE